LGIIYAIPGLGTTKELLSNISVTGYEIKVLDWPGETHNVSLKEYSKFFLNYIDSREPVNLLGVSFGGMICMELAGLIKVRSVTLISSAKCRSELPYFIRALKYIPIHKYIPENAQRLIAVNSGRFLGFKKEEIPFFRKMIYSMPPFYFSRCIDMIVNWDMKRNGTAVNHIHGNSDRLIPIRYIKKCHIIQKGTHVMVYNRAGEINGILNSIYNGL
jgi:hypothetical protein